MQDILRFDALWRPEDLEAIDRRLYEPKERELQARTILSLKTDIDPGAETFGYDVLTRRGAAKIFAHGADDVPLVDADIERVTARIYSIVAGFHYTVQEMRAARLAGRAVDAIRADTVRKAIAEKENDIAFKGDAEYNLTGLLSWPGIQIATAANNLAGTSTKWKDKSGMEIIADIREARKLINSQPGHQVDTLCLPPEQYEELERPVSDLDTRPIRRYLQDVGWFRRIVQVDALEGAGAGGTDSLLALDSSPDVVQLVIPMDITRHDVYQDAPFRFLVPVEERTGGVIVRYPLGICRMDGI